MAVLISLTTIAAGVSTAVAADSRPYTLDYGDNVRVRATEWPALDGVVIVGPDGSVSIPLVGNIQAKGKTVHELADLIAVQLRSKNKLTEVPDVSTSITKYRPYFILGYIQTPGEYDYEPDLTVLKAISKGGGLYRRGGADSERIARDVIVARSELRLQKIQAVRQKIRLARIKAELSGKDSFDISAELSQAAEDPQVGEILAKERAILTANVTLLRQKKVASESLAQLSKEEIRSLELQAEAVVKQISIAQSEKARVNQLSERGLQTNTRVMETELSYGKLVESHQALQTLIVRARQEILKAETHFEELAATEQKRLRDDQQESAMKLHEAELAQERNRQLIIEAEVVSAGTIRRATRNKGFYRTRIDRGTGEQHIQIEAEDTTYVEPGDVVYIEQITQDLDTTSSNVPAGEPKRASF